MFNLNKRPLILLGSGGFAREALQWAYAARVEVAAFFTESGDWPDRIHGVPVFKTLDNFEPREFDFLPAVGDPGTRQHLYELAEGKGFRACDPIIHPSAIVGGGVLIGPGSLICPGSVLTTNIRIGKGFQMNLGCTVGHDARIGDFVTLAPGAKISGNTVIQERVYIGTNASVREKIHISQDAIVGMGAAVIKDVAPDTIVGGVPARQIG